MTQRGISTLATVDTRGNITVNGSNATQSSISYSPGSVYSLGSMGGFNNNYSSSLFISNDGLQLNLQLQSAVVLEAHHMLGVCFAVLLILWVVRQHATRGRAHVHV